MSIRSEILDYCSRYRYVTLEHVEIAQFIYKLITDKDTESIEDIKGCPGQFSTSGKYDKLCKDLQEDEFNKRLCKRCWTKALDI